MNMTPRHTVAIVIALAAAGFIAGCLSLEAMAPPVGPRFVHAAGERGVTLQTLKRGRFIYVTDCARCHGIEPIQRYSTERWRAIVWDMADDARLDRMERDALEAYVVAARDVVAQGTE